MIKHIGCGECPKCKTHVEFLLTGDTRPAQDGGTLWVVALGEYCPVCFFIPEWFYESPIILEMPMRAAVKVVLQ